MKIALLLVLVVIFAGCEGRHSMVSLTAEQAQETARQLANNQAATLYHCRPFDTGHAAKFEAGKWMWAAQQAFGEGDIQATVELAADGLTNSVKLQLMDNRSLLR